MAPSVFDQPPKMRNLFALLVLLSTYNGYPLKAMDQEHSNMNFTSKCGHYWRGNGGGDILLESDYLITPNPDCMMISASLLSLPLELSTKSMQPFEEIGVLSVLAKDGTQGANIHEILNGLPNW